MRRTFAGLVIALAALVVGSTAYGASPNPALTPGAANPAVTQANVATTVCRPGYTKTVRNVSNATKSRVYAEYSIPQAQKRFYVIDHLIPLEEGGGNDITNLWPQLKADAKKKDVLENLVHARLCSGAMGLLTAQHAFLLDLSAIPAPLPATTAPVTDAPAPAAETPGGGATAVCNDGTYSYAANHQGACSHHGGVAQFYK